jgi:enoyl-CoA hydratase
VNPRRTGIQTELSGPLAVVSIGDGERAVNLLDLDTLNDLHRCLGNLEDNSGLRAVILRGMSGGAFVAGADLRQVASLDADSALPFSRLGQSLMQRMLNSSLVFIAAVDGPCMGGGFDLFLACDLRFASAKAKFRHPGARIGIITGWGGTAMLPRELGAGPARTVLNSGMTLTAEDAFHFGLISEIVAADELMARCREWAAMVAEIRRERVALWKRAQRMTS